MLWISNRKMNVVGFGLLFPQLRFGVIFFLTQDLGQLKVVLNSFNQGFVECPSQLKIVHFCILVFCK